MPQGDRFPRIPPQFSFLTLTKHKLALSVLALFLARFFCLAQEQCPVPQVSTPNLRAIEKKNLFVPALARGWTGTTFANGPSPLPNDQHLTATGHAVEQGKALCPKAGHRNRLRVYYDHIIWPCWSLIKAAMPD